ncbi:PREDICTED: HEAT repeat-containing protein 5B-like [Priapulus caudatus]|uniref:HEAT repeat-containing protein 5B-like n=1 Tax=Priapulus caudatus TaxID=37621 RepID=A0ABM1EWS6_PRICU|nr:PREDICTED: HEAT repeat-containing protein 5B-like [Priapulus caudatus]
MYSFLLHCPELVTDDVTRRLRTPTDAALVMLANLTSMLKSYGAPLKANAAMVRLKLYQTLSLIPPESYEGSYSSLLRELVAEFTLTDNPSNTTTSMLRSMCHHDDSVILGSWLQETDHKAIEDQLQPNSASGSGALEHDMSYVYLKCPEGESMPGPLPLGVAVIDKSMHLFGIVFPRVTHNKHRVQMLEHFMECIRQAKSSRQEAVQMNIFTAFLAAMKGLVETKGSLGQDDVKKAAIQLIMSALASSNPILRCAAGEALGRMAQVVGDNRFVADMAQFSFDKLKSARDVVTRTGHSLALGCLHKYVGGLSTGQHLNTSVSILLALAQDSTSPAVQVWALHALALIADSGGPMFRGYVEPTLSLCLRLMLSVPPSNTDVHQCLGKCLSALITTVGPELQANTSPIITARSSFLVACAVMQDHSDSLVQAEAIACLQQLHMFAPRHVNLSTLVPKLCVTLSSPHLLLRRAAVACLRQLSHREAPEVCEYAMTLVDSKDWKIDITETGLEGMLFAMLDTENDRSLVSDIHDTLISMLQSLAGENLTRWLALCKQVLSASSEFMLSPEEEAAAAREEADDDAGAEATFKAGEEPESHPLVAARWPTRVFAVDCMQKIVAVCKDDSAAHFDLALARKHKQHNVKSDFLVLHLPELVRMTFISATSDSDQLRMAGLKALQNVITTFSRVPEPEFPGHFILEQFQAQVGAALRPAFSPDTGPNVTAAACQVCSTWIGSGVACDLNDLRRVHQLLVSSLAKLKSGKGSSSQLYSETAATMEKLAVLKAWAEVYIVAMETDKADKSKVSTPVDDEEDEDFADFQGVAGGESLLSLVTPELVSLSKHWLAALKDYALLSLPPEFASQLPPEGGAFYKAETIESTRPLYRDAWYPIVHAAALWLNNGGFENVAAEREKVDVEGSTNLGLGAANASATKVPDEINTDRFHLIQGICVEALCSPRTVHPVECVMACLNALHQLLDKPWSRSVIGQDQSLGVELLNVLHRLLLTRELASTQTLVIDVARQVLKTAQEHLELAKRVKAKEADLPANQDLESPLVGEGGESGEIVIGKSLVFAFLEVCMCLLVRHMPQLNPALPTAAPPQQQQQPRREVAPPLTPEAQQLVGSAVHIMSELPALCTPQGSLNVLPTVLILTTGVLKYTSPRQIEETVAPSTACTSALHSLKHLTAHPMARDRSCGDTWVALLRSSLTTILDFAEPDPTTNWPGMDETVTMLALAVFIVSSPPEVVCVPILHDKCVNVFREALEAKYHVVRIKCLQTVASIFQHPSRAVATPYIHGLASLVLKHLYAASLSKNGLSEPDVAVIVEETKVVETLVHLAEEEHRITLLKILVPLLVSYLLDSSKLPSSSRAQKLLHERSLQKLMEIGPKFPEQFRAVMAGAPPVRTALEDAVKFSQQRSAASATKQAQDKFISQQQSAPSIKLKMDFSNFSG